MLITVDLPEDLVQALDKAVAVRREQYQEKKKSKTRALTPREKGMAAAIAEREGQSAANAWIKKTTSGVSKQETAGRPKDCPSRRLLLEELLRFALTKKGA
jgi:hypothetical protein